MANYKRLLAVGLAAAMLMGSSAVAFAADQEGSSSGEGETQFISKSDVFDVVLPTVAEDATTFDYLLDPEGLIAETEGDRYTGKVFDDDKTVYFLRSSQVDGTVKGADGKVDYTDKSDEIKVVNKSTEAVDLKVSAKVTEVPSEITMAASNTFSGTDAELYLALLGTDGTTPTEKAISADGVELAVNIPADAAAYEVKWNAAAGAYEKQLTDAAKEADYTGFKSYSFQLTGVCNTTEGTNWSGLTDKAPKVDLTWSVKDFTVTGPQITISDTGLITISNLTADKNYSGLSIENSNGGPYDINSAPVTWNEENYNPENGGTTTCQMGEVWLSTLRGITGKAHLSLTDGTIITIDINIPAAP